MKNSFSQNSEGDHTSDRLSDLHDPKSPTWWQSETIYEGIQFPTAVNLTLNLGKHFHDSIRHFNLNFIFLQASLSTSLTSASCSTRPDQNLSLSTSESIRKAHGHLINTTVPPVEALTVFPTPFQFRRARTNRELCVPASTVTFHLCNSETSRSHR